MKLLDFPLLRQTYEYDCGVIALQAILVYYGIEVREDVLLKSMKTRKTYGTPITVVLNSLKKYDLKFDSGTMTIKDLKNYIDKKIPVMILLQAWSDKAIKYTKDYRDGHWVVVVGYNERKVFFEDPYAFERAFLTKDELNERWHAKENSKKMVSFGIAVYGQHPSYRSTEIIHMS